MRTLNKLRDEIHEYAISKGFWDYDLPEEYETILKL
jgi:hypothetical protein